MEESTTTPSKEPRLTAGLVAVKKNMTTTADIHPDTSSYYYNDDDDDSNVRSRGNTTTDGCHGGVWGGMWDS